MSTEEQTPNPEDHGPGEDVSATEGAGTAPTGPDSEVPNPSEQPEPVAPEEPATPVVPDTPGPATPGEPETPGAPAEPPAAPEPEPAEAPEPSDAAASSEEPATPEQVGVETPAAEQAAAAKPAGEKGAAGKKSGKKGRRKSRRPPQKPLEGPLPFDDLREAGRAILDQFGGRVACRDAAQSLHQKERDTFADLLRDAGDWRRELRRRSGGALAHRALDRALAYQVLSVAEDLDVCFAFLGKEEAADVAARQPAPRRPGGGRGGPRRDGPGGGGPRRGGGRRDRDDRPRRPRDDDREPEVHTFGEGTGDQSGLQIVDAAAEKEREKREREERRKQEREERIARRGY